jgi:DNA-directed RNA polymerase subunit H (RpoH/RPB5)
MATKKVKEEDDKKEIDLFGSNLVPGHELLTDEQKKAFLEKMNISMKQLPRIKSNDPVVKKIGGKRGDVIKITRKSPIATEYIYYRVVI